MKIAIFIDHLDDYLLYKDFGQIGLGFQDLGHEVLAITYDLKSNDFPIKSIQVTEGDLCNPDFWNTKKIDILIFYSWLSYRFSKILKIISEFKLKVILKLDSNGRLGYPLLPSYLKGFGSFVSIRDFANYFIRFFQWLFLLKIISKKKIEQMKYADFVIIETPDALVNLYYLTLYYKLGSLLNKLVFITNPVLNDYIVEPLDDKKQNIIISIGRWNDRAKNREGLLFSLKEFLKYDQQWTFVIIGPDSDYFKNKIYGLPEDLKNKIILIGKSDHIDIAKYLKKSKILLIPSRWESFGLVAAEAVSLGCTICGTPNESLRYLSRQGFSGSVSTNFNRKSILSTLLLETRKWQRDEYNPNVIANYWRKQLDRKIIAQKILNLFSELK